MSALPDDAAVRQRIAANLLEIVGGRRGWQTDLARETGESPVSVHRWATGKVTPPIRWLMVVADLYNTTLDRIVGRQRDPGQTAPMHFYRSATDHVATTDHVASRVKRGAVEMLLFRDSEGNLHAVEVKDSGPGMEAADLAPPPVTESDNHSDNHDAGT